MEGLVLFKLITNEIKKFSRDKSSIAKSTLLNKHFKEGNAALRNENVSKQIVKNN